MHFQLTTNDNSTIKILEVANVLFDPSGDINLIASEDINKTDWDVNLSANPFRSGLYYYPPGSTVPAARVPIGQAGKLLTLILDNHAVQVACNDPTCFNARCGNTALEELIHQSMAHYPIPTLAKMSHLVDGLPLHLHFPKMLRVP
eukprot:1638569-Rhodomonas_salina.1